MTTEKKRSLKKDALVQTLLICLWGLLTLALAFLLVLEIVTVTSEDGVVVQEKIEVSPSSLSPANVPNKVYSNHITGMLANRTEKSITVECVRVWVRGMDGAETLVVLDGFVIPERSTTFLDKRFEKGTPYDTVTRVEVSVNGVSESLMNVSTAEQSPVNSATLLYAALLVPLVWLLVRASKKRYYIFQESKMVE